MPDLGKYGVEVLSAYAISIALIVGLIVLSWRASRASVARLRDAEERQKNG